MQSTDPINALVILARSAHGEPIEVGLSRDAAGRMRVASVAAPIPGSPAPGPRLELPQHILLPPATEPHAHLDKALSWGELNAQVGDLGAAVATWRHGAAGFDEQSFLRRARAAALLMLANGTTAVRTHVDVLPDADPFRAIRAITTLRAELAAKMTIEIVVLAPPGTPETVILGALDAGADLVGGAPHLADDPRAETIRLIGIAERRGVGVDLHTDEFLVGEHGTILTFADLVQAWPAERVRTAGHCCRLSMMGDEQLHSTIVRVREAGISVVALPITNLFLQGRSATGVGPRGIAPIDALREGGVRVAAGADNIRDPFNAMGRADALETASLLVTAAHQKPELALDLVTSSARAVMGLEPAGPVVDALADFVAIRAADVTEAIAMAPADRVVIVDGQVVCRTESTTTWL